MRVAVIGCALVALVGGQAVAGDLLPLKAGGYVDESVTCGQASNATSVMFRGDGFHSSQTLETDKVVGRHGHTYRVLVSMSDASDILHPKPMKPFTETITVHSSTRFTLANPYGTFTYRWCNEDMTL